MDALLQTLLAVLVVAVAGSVLSWLLYVPIIVRVFGETPWLVASSYAPRSDAEECTFLSSDHVRLSGSYLRTTASHRVGVLLFCHELGGDRWGCIPYVEDLLRQGFDVFTFDFRNHGGSNSSSNYRPMPWLSHYELADVRGAINYLMSRPDADPKGIGVIGVSKGGNAVLCSAARDARVRAIVTDGAFPTGAMQRHYIRRFMGIYIRATWLARYLPDWCLLSFCEWAKLFVGLRRNCRLVNVEQIVRNVRQPVFMIHGGRDGYVPPEVARTLRTCLAGRSKLWVVPGVKHNGAVTHVTDEYHRRIARFFLWAFESGPRRRLRHQPARPIVPALEVTQNAGDAA